MRRIVAMSRKKERSSDGVVSTERDGDSHLWEVNGMEVVIGSGKPYCAGYFFFFVRLRLRWSCELGLPLRCGLIIVRVLVSSVES